MKDMREDVEEAYVKARLQPREPTEAERLKHEAAHLPYRAWCPQRVGGRGRCKPHYRRTEDLPENAVPKLSMDYFFLGGEVPKAGHSYQSSQFHMCFGLCAEYHP